MVLKISTFGKAKPSPNTLLTTVTLIVLEIGHSLIDQQILYQPFISLSNEEFDAVLNYLWDQK